MQMGVRPLASVLQLTRDKRRVMEAKKPTGASRLITTRDRVRKVEARSLASVLQLTRDKKSKKRGTWKRKSPQAHRDVPPRETESVEARSLANARHPYHWSRKVPQSRTTPTQSFCNSRRANTIPQTLRQCTSQGSRDTQRHSRTQANPRTFSI